MNIRLGMDIHIPFGSKAGYGYGGRAGYIHTHFCPQLCTLVCLGFYITHHSNLSKFLVGSNVLDLKESDGDNWQGCRR